MSSKKMTVAGLARLPAFCHAVIAGDFIYVSGTLGAKDDKLELVEGGIRAETKRTLAIISQILEACNADLTHLVKVNVFLKDMTEFAAMNEVYCEIMGDDPPARITVGRADLALGAAIEIDAIAYKKEDWLYANPLESI